LSYEDLVRTLKDLRANEPRAVFFGTNEPFDSDKFNSLDEVSNAATALDVHTPKKDGFVNIVVGVPANALTPRYLSGDTSFYEQAYLLNRDRLPDKPTVYCVPRAQFEK